jgi:hypothetical protein
MRVSKLSRGAQTFLEGAQPPPATPWLRHCFQALNDSYIIHLIEIDDKKDE